MLKGAFTLSPQYYAFQSSHKHMLLILTFNFVVDFNVFFISYEFLRSDVICIIFFDATNSTMRVQRSCNNYYYIYKL